MSDGLFVGKARVQSMVKDFNALRRSIASWDAEKTEEIWTKRCERWVGQLEVKSNHDQE